MTTPIASDTPLILFPIGLSDRVRSVLQAYLDGTSDGSVDVGDEEAAQVAFCEYDNLAAHEVLQRFQTLRRRPLILVAMRDPAVGGAIWVPKPVYPTSLPAAVDAARRMLLAGQASDFVLGAGSVTRTVLQSFMHDTARLPMPETTTSPGVVIRSPAPTERVPQPVAETAGSAESPVPSAQADRSSERYQLVLQRASEAVNDGRMDHQGNRRGRWVAVGALATVAAGVVAWNLMDSRVGLDNVAAMLPPNASESAPTTAGSTDATAVTLATAPATSAAATATAVAVADAPAATAAQAAAAVTPAAPAVAASPVEAPVVVAAKPDAGSLDLMPATSAGPRSAESKADVKPVAAGNVDKAPAKVAAAAATVQSEAKPAAAPAETRVASAAPTAAVAKASAKLQAEAPASTAAAAAAPPATAASDSIVVAQGDTLSSIAARTMGTSKAYQRLFQANSGVLQTPHQIYPGQVLRVPKAPGAN